MKPSLIIRPFSASFILCTLSFIFAGTKGWSQIVQNRPDKAVMESYDNTGKPFSRSARNKTDGSPYLNPDWGSGTIYFQNGKRSLPMEVQFNLQKNQLTFRQQGKVMGFADPVKAFRILYVFEDSLRDEFFRNGYPEVNSRSSEYFFQVMEQGGNYHLVADRSKQLIDDYTYLGGEKNSFRNYDDLYIFDSTAVAMYPIKPGKKQPLDAPSNLRKRVSDIARDSSLNLRDPAEWRKVVMILNR